MPVKNDTVHKSELPYVRTVKKVAVDSEWSMDKHNVLVPMCLAFVERDDMGGKKRTKFWRWQMAEARNFIEEHRDCIFVAHNVEGAEGRVWWALGLDPTEYRWHDTMLSMIAQFNTDSKSVKYDLLSCLKRARIDDGRSHDEKSKNQSAFIYCPETTPWVEHIQKLDAQMEELGDYCLADAEYLLDLDDALEARFNDPSRFRCDIVVGGRYQPLMSRNEMSDYWGKLAAIFAKAECKGIPLNPLRVRALLGNAKEALVAEQKSFEKKYPGCFRLVKGKYTACDGEMRKYAVKVYMGVDGEGEVPVTKTGRVSLSKDDLKPYADSAAKDPSRANFLSDLYCYKKKAQALSSFIKPTRDRNWLGYFDGKAVHPMFGLLRAVTGRCGMKPSQGFIYTMPKFMRGLVDPPKGFVILEFDFSSEEIGIQAYLTGEPVKARMYEKPQFGKYYCDVAHSFWSDFVSKDDKRYKTAKAMSLMTEYGCGAKKLASVARVPKWFARTFIQHMHRLFPTYWKYVEGLQKMVIDRKKQLAFPDGFSVTASRSAKPTTFGNWPFQGMGAVILRQIVLDLDKAGIQLVAPIHDAVAVMCREEDIPQVKAKVVDIMEAASKKFVGTAIKVGAPEITYHGIVNCHSECETREDYAKLKDKLESTDDYDAREYYAEYDKYVASNLPKTDVLPEDRSPWYDEFEEDEYKFNFSLDNQFWKGYIS